MSGHHRAERPHFLLATDLPPALPHLAFAAQLGERLHAQTTLLHVQVPITVPALDGIGTATAVETSPAACRRRLRELAGGLGTTSPPHVAVDVGADPPAAILAAAERLHADLIVLPTHGRSGLSRALLGSFAEQVLRRTRRPVLMLTDAMVQGESRAGRGPVMLATDLSPAASTAAKAAADLARRLQVPLVLFSVVPEKEPPPLGGGVPVAARPAPPLQRVQERLRALRRFAADLGGDVAVSVDVHDDAAAAIVHEAKAQAAALLVVATHGRRGIARVLLGSVAEHVVRKSTVPVVCVPVDRE